MSPTEWSPADVDEALALAEARLDQLRAWGEQMRRDFGLVVEVSLRLTVASTSNTSTPRKGDADGH